MSACCAPVSLTRSSHGMLQQGTVPSQGAPDARPTVTIAGRFLTIHRVLGEGTGAFRGFASTRGFLSLHVHASRLLHGEPRLHPPLQILMLTSNMGIATPGSHPSLVHVCRGWCGASSPRNGWTVVFCVESLAGFWFPAPRCRCSVNGPPIECVGHVPALPPAPALAGGFAKVLLAADSSGQQFVIKWLQVQVGIVVGPPPSCSATPSL